MMNNFLEDTWEVFNEETKGKRIYLFGYNSAIGIIKEMRKFGHPWKIAGIVDNDSNKHGSVKINDAMYYICSPQSIVEKWRKNEDAILICGTYTHEISSQLDGMGIHEYYSDFWMNRSDRLKANIVPQKLDDENLKNVRGHLADNDSRIILDAVINKRKCGEIDYTDIMYRGKSEYFIEEYWNPFWDGAIIDGGAYDGDTIEEIAEVTKNGFSKIYSFEPQRDLADIIHKKVLWRYGDRVEFFDKGLWSTRTELHFENGDSSVSGKINEEAATIISTCRIDDVVKGKVSFIKMDIEGAEAEALRGAKETIKRDRPCLAICIYHKPSHLWEIPILIHEFVPEYNLYIKHCGASMQGTILYARI